LEKEEKKKNVFTSFEARKRRKNKQKHTLTCTHMKEKEDREHRGDFQTPEQWFLALLEVIGKIKYDTDFSPTTSNSLRRRLED